MTRNKILAVVLAVAGIIAAVILAVYISGDNSAEKKGVDLYFINQDGTGIVSEPQKIRYRTDDDLIRGTLDKLRRGPSSGKLGAIMPKDTQISGIELSGGGFLTVNFSDRFLSEDP